MCECIIVKSVSCDIIDTTASERF